jgi:hypothetical protein
MIENVDAISTCKELHIDANLRITGVPYCSEDVLKYYLAKNNSTLYVYCAPVSDAWIEVTWEKFNSYENANIRVHGSVYIE